MSNVGKYFYLKLINKLIFDKFIRESSSSTYHAQTYHNVVKEIVDNGIVFCVNNNIYYGDIDNFSTENKRYGIDYWGVEFT